MRAAALLLVLLCAACGKQGPLLPKAGVARLPTPQAAAAAPTPAELLQRPVQSAPVRVDDPLRSSTERPDDRFNLPPKH